VKYETQILTQTSVVASIMIACALYLWRIEIRRPPIGRFNRADVTTITVIIIAIPFAYAALPVAVASTVFGIVFCTAIQTALSPIVGGRIATMITLAIAAADIALAIWGRHGWITVANDIIVGCALVGVTNIWVQSGAKASYVAVFAGVLAIYDPIVTWLSPLMQQLFVQLTDLPFAPLLSLVGHIRLRLGLGDALMFALWPVVLAKAYGRVAAWIGGALSIGTLVVIEVLLLAGRLPNLVAVMAIYGPVVVLQYVVLRLTRGPERTTAAWRASRTARHTERVESVDGRTRALAAARELDQLAAGTYAAFDDGVLVGTGHTPAQARRSARLAGCPAVPVVVRTG
jgi:hypothetical protein